jgi:hypothetical protein
MELMALEKKRAGILKKIQGLGDMRSGSISVRYQQCGKRPCVCHDPGHPGHGPIYSFSEVINGRTKIRNFKLGPELDKLKKEVENYQAFKKLSQELIAVSNNICALRPTPTIQDTDELQELKKNLQKAFMKKYKKRLPG